MPDAYGNFKGISLPEIPWHKPKDDEVEKPLIRDTRARFADYLAEVAGGDWDAPQE